jgi:predicted acyltransferase
MGKVEIRKRRVWRRRTYIWVLSVLIAVFALIYFEQTAVLFVLSTLAMCALLTTVALADLEGRDKEMVKRTNESKNVTETKPATERSVPALAVSSGRRR